MKFILGKKKEMQRRFESDGKSIPVTIIEAGPVVVCGVKTVERDGYTAVQVGYGQKRRLTKPLRGYFKELGSFRYLKEFRISRGDSANYKRGDKITIAEFNKGDKVAVTGVSSGKGFQGVVKRHNFAGSPASHGHKDQLRMPGSIGSGFPEHVFKGKRMAGRMGNQQITVKNLEVIDIDLPKNILLVKGAVPGRRNSLLQITQPSGAKKQVKAKEK